MAPLLISFLLGSGAFAAGLAQPAPAKPEPIPVVNDIGKCGRLKVGQSELVAFMDDDQSPTGTSAIYKLSRPSDDLFVIELNTYYHRGKGYNGGLADGEIDPFYREKVSKCFKTFAPSMKGPGGRRLEIRLSRDPAIPEREIAIMPKGYHTSRYRYEADITCAIILHETLHLLGLNDEYPDQNPDTNPEEVFPPEVFEISKKKKVSVSLDCRATAPDDSVMFRHDMAVERSTGITKLMVDECVCMPSVDCRELALKSDGKNCPAGSAWRKGSFDQKPDGGSREKFAVREYFVLSTSTSETLAEIPAEKETVLYPAHFRALTEPGCTDVNADFYACTRNAYRSSFVMPVSLGFSMHPWKGCLPKPKACEGKSTSWLD